MHDCEKYNSRPSQHSTLLISAIVGLLIVVAVGSRHVLIDWPNFKPVFAIAIFIGFLVSSRVWAVLSVFAMMILSDLFIGFYELPLMIAVYGCMLLACCLGFGVKYLLQRSESVTVRTISITCAAISGSVLFFVVSNIAVCAAGWYPANVEGAIQALTAGIPFFKYTIAGDVGFTLIVFSTYYAIANSAYSWKSGTSACRSGNRKISASGS